MTERKEMREGTLTLAAVIIVIVMVILVFSGSADVVWSTIFAIVLLLGSVGVWLLFKALSSKT